MELVERDGFLATLNSKLKTVSGGEGHTVFLSGVAGIGKTSLIKAFCKDVLSFYNVYTGTCDALFTPRPLAPLYDIAWQIRNDFWQDIGNMSDRALLFTRFYHELAHQLKPSIIVFEDIHWADEATLDFVKFLARRITQLKCLFILSYRDDEIHSGHPLTNFTGQLPRDSFSRLELTYLSQETVKRMALGKGYDGDYVFKMTGGNPFYVNEVLASYNTDVPESIKDVILSAYHRSNETTKKIWDLLAVIPDGLEIRYLEKYEPGYAQAIEACLQSQILVIKDRFIFFKHELFRKAVENSLSPLKRISLNERILELFIKSFEQNNQIERIVHHAKNANEHEVVVHYAPLAAAHAASVGAHIEAAKLYLTAIEYYQDTDKNILLRFYEDYAYECYLTNQIKEAIIYTTKSLHLLTEKSNVEKTGNCLRFLSQLWFFEGKLRQAENFAKQAIDVLDKRPSSTAKAMAYCNMSQLKIRSDEPEDCIFWGEKAIAMGRELDNEEILTYALNNVGFIQARMYLSKEKGIGLLKKSLDIALRNSYHEHAARAYANLGHNEVIVKEYQLAKNTLEAGLKYCEERNLDSWTDYMLSSKARLLLETSFWNEAYKIADTLLKNENQIPLVKIQGLVTMARIKMRLGDSDAVTLLMEAKIKAFEAMEMQRIIPVVVALLEYEWITGDSLIEQEEISSVLSRAEKVGDIHENSELAFWLSNTKNETWKPKLVHEGYRVNNEKMVTESAVIWEELDCSYQQALILFQGQETQKKKAISIVNELGAKAVYEKMKFDMRAFGIKRIPRGVNKTTQQNPSLLTDREIDVLKLLNEGLQNKEIASKLFISAKTVEHHISSILFKLDVNSRSKAVREAVRLEIIE